MRFDDDDAEHIVEFAAIFAEGVFPELAASPRYVGDSARAPPSPRVDAPAAEEPAAETPAAETPAAETPAAEEPPAEPAAEAAPAAGEGEPAAAA